MMKHTATKKRAPIVLLCIIFALFGMAGAVFGFSGTTASAEPPDTSPDDYWYENTGDGTPGDPFIISTARQLHDLALRVNAGTNFAGQYIELGAPIDLSIYDDQFDVAGGGYGWTSIGTTVAANAGNSFDGNFDGQGYTVTGLTYVRSSDNTRAFGLFGSVADNARIRNIVLEDGLINITGNVNNMTGVGSIIGRMAGSARLYDSFSDVIISAYVDGGGGLVGWMHNTTQIIDSGFGGRLNRLSTPGHNFGGIVGRMSNTPVVDGAFVDGAILHLRNTSGGIAGRIDGGRISNSFVRANTVIDIGGSGAAAGGNANSVGGLIGNASVQHGPIVIENSYNAADIIMRRDTNAAGGLIGLVDGGNNAHTFTLRHSFNSGNIIMSADFATFQSVGGVIGNFNVHGDITSAVVANVANFGQVTGRQDVGGLFGRTSNPISINVSNSANFGQVAATIPAPGFTGVGGIAGIAGLSATPYTNVFTVAADPGFVPITTGGFTHTTWTRPTAAFGTFAPSAGALTNTGVRTAIQLQTPATYAAWSAEVWRIVPGSFPIQRGHTFFLGSFDLDYGTHDITAEFDGEALTQDMKLVSGEPITFAVEGESSFGVVLGNVSGLTSYQLLTDPAAVFYVNGDVIFDVIGADLLVFSVNFYVDGNLEGTVSTTDLMVTRAAFTAAGGAAWEAIPSGHNRFLGWFDGLDVPFEFGATLATSMNVHALFYQFEINFIVDGNVEWTTESNTVTQTQINENTDVSVIPTGYNRFLGWFTVVDGEDVPFVPGTFDDTYVGSSFDVYARFGMFYNITVVGGTVAIGDYDDGYLRGSLITVRANVPAGQRFVNWTIGGNVVSNQASFTLPVTGNITITANFAAITSVTVHFFTGNGTAADGNTVPSITATPGGTFADLPTPVRPGFVFVGWNTQLDGQGTMIADGDTINTTSDITLYAIWEAVVHPEPESSGCGSGSVAAGLLTLVLAAGGALLFVKKRG